MRRGLSSLLRQQFQPDELLIIDDGSSDGTEQEVAALKDTFPAANILYHRLEHPEHRISCVPRNVGIKLATSDIVVFTEAETLHVGETLQGVVSRCVPGKNFPVATQVWSTGPNIYNHLPEPYFNSPELFLSHPYAALVSGNMQNNNAPDADWGITGGLNCWAGCLFAVDRASLLDVGGFDEEFTGHGWDDFDLYARLELKGLQRLACNDLAVIHLWHPKNYPYNIYEHADRNGTRSADRIKSCEYRANIGKEWGLV
jgi:GT2 family glycosyltransferase